MIPKNELHAAELYDLSLKTLETHLNLDIDGYRCDPKMALTALVKAALDGLASASVIWRFLRLTLALTYVVPEDSTLAVLQRLLERLSVLQIRPGVIYPDKGFCSSAFIRYLQVEQQPAVFACPIRGKDGGTRALCCGRKSYRTTYTFTDGTEVEMAVVATLPTRQGR